MEPYIEYINTALNAKMRVTAHGKPYWYGRDLMEILDYARWENFVPVIEKAKVSCDNSGMFSTKHFLYKQEVIEVGNGARTKRENMVLSKYACYLIAMNGDAAKPQIATAQTYFAAQTHKQEIEQALSNEQRRLLLRERIRDANKKLFSAAKAAGVTRFAIFQDAGYRGLYDGRGSEEIKRIKGIPNNEELLDCIDREELAANEFRATQTESKLRRDNVQGESKATRTHFDVGRHVRKAIAEIKGTMPEQLPAAPSIKKLAQKQAKDTKQLKE